MDAQRDQFNRAEELFKRQVVTDQEIVQRRIVRAPLAGTILRVDVRAGEYVGTPPGKSLVVLGDTTRAHVRVSIDEHDIGRFRPGVPATAHARGDTSRPLSLTFVRIVPFVEPKRMLTGQGDERVDTRVLQVIYSVAPSADETSSAQLFMGQQVDVRIEPPSPQAE